MTRCESLIYDIYRKRDNLCLLNMADGYLYNTSDAQQSIMDRSLTDINQSMYGKLEPVESREYNIVGKLIRKNVIDDAFTGVVEHINKTTSASGFRWHLTYYAKAHIRNRSISRNYAMPPYYGRYM